MAHSSSLSDEDKLKSGDYVEDSVFGVVPKDVPTLLRIREEDLQHELMEAGATKAQAKEAVKATGSTGGNTK